jgi:catechol 2,3-dioxygenase-like lactoylglutathione lyase family enzyme
LTSNFALKLQIRESDMTFYSQPKNGIHIMMMDHLELSTQQFDQMCAFYDAVLAPLGISRIVKGSPAGYGMSDVLPFWLRSAQTPTQNAHYAFVATSRALVHAAYEAALQAGATDPRAPALHPHIDPNYYAGYARDPDGHLVEFVCRAVG